MENINKILILEAGGIGDLVISVPAIRAIRKKYPKAYMALLVSKRVYQLIKNCPYVDQVFDFEIDNFTFSRHIFNIRRTISSLHNTYKLRKKKFDLVINLHGISSFGGNFKMLVLFKILRPRVSLGRSDKNKGNFYDLKTESVPQEKIHEADKKLEIVSLLGAETLDKKLELWLDNSDQEAADKIMLKCGIKDNDLVIGINPNTFQIKKWKIQNFAKLADSLIEKYNAKIIFFGANKERKRVEEVRAFMRNKAIDLSGKLSIRQYVAMIKKLKLFITHDSGPMHIASVYKIPTVAFFLPHKIYPYSPYNNENAVVLSKPSLNQIAVKAVLKAIDSLLKV